MDRRDFLKLSGLSGLALATPLVGARTAHAADPYAGKFFIYIHAGGGWDPTSFIDPKGKEGDRAMNNAFTEIRSAGNIRYPAGIYDPQDGQQGAAGYSIFGGQQQFQNFFEKHSSRLTVINGIDVGTNDHDGGTRAMASGELREGFPSYAALFASQVAKDKPMAYFGGGGYTFTGGLVPVTRANNVRALQDAAYPNRWYADDVTFHTDKTMKRITDAQRQRNTRLISGNSLNRYRSIWNTLFTVRDGDNEMKRLTDLLDGLQLQGAGIQQQARLALVAYRAGLAASASLSYGGFDTHNRHDEEHIPQLRELLYYIDWIYEEIGSQGISHDNVVILVGSDFGRTPFYNATTGKDHWSISSMFAMGGGVPGNRRIGETTYDHRAKKLNPDTLAVDDAAGIRITPHHVSQSLRGLLGIAETPGAAAFPVPPDVRPMKLFG